MLAQTRTRTSAGSSVFEFKKENLPPIQNRVAACLYEILQSPARLKWAGDEEGGDSNEGGDKRAVKKIKSA